MPGADAWRVTVKLRPRLGGWQLLVAAAVGTFTVGMVAVVSTRWHPSCEHMAIMTDEHFIEGLGGAGRAINTKSPIAQRYFNQGLAFLYGFNFEAASKSFKAAAINDPQCAMAFWGMAMAQGPNINAPVTSADQLVNARKALKSARSLSDRCPPIERALIEALSRRYGSNDSTRKASNDVAYADAMRRIRKLFPGDPDVGALTAEAILELRPWDQWKSDGSPQPGTQEAIEALNEVLRLRPRHLLGLHMLIHAIEGSRHPEGALDAANALRRLAPSLGHLVHMPSHIDVRCGRWNAAVIANQRAIEAEDALCRVIGTRESFRVSTLHNYHMLAFAAMMLGDRRTSTKVVREMVAAIPSDFRDENDEMVDGFFALPFEVYLRFGEWDAMLSEPQPNDRMLLSVALWRCCRGVAWAAMNNVQQAKNEQDAFVFSATTFLRPRVSASVPSRNCLTLRKRCFRARFCIVRDEWRPHYPTCEWQFGSRTNSRTGNPLVGWCRYVMCWARPCSMWAATERLKMCIEKIFQETTRTVGRCRAWVAA